MKTALATCSNLPDWEIDDRSFHDALTALGVEYDLVPWDDPTAAWSSYRACLLRTTWDYMERREEFIEWIQTTAEKTTLSNPANVLVWNTHKSYLKDLEVEGVPIAPTEWLACKQPACVSEMMARRGWDRGFLKPQVGATARETLRFELDNLNEAQQHVDRVLASESLMLQPYLESVETKGEVSLLFFNEISLTCGSKSAGRRRLSRSR